MCRLGAVSLREGQWLKNTAQTNTTSQRKVSCRTPTHTFRISDGFVFQPPNLPNSLFFFLGSGYNQFDLLQSPLYLLSGSCSKRKEKPSKPRRYVYSYIATFT